LIATAVGCLIVIIVAMVVLGVIALGVVAYFFEDALNWLENPYIPDWVGDVIQWMLLFN
jgi:uncharacterized protein involved in cysteine biosynthesis